jgi:hypothetical protein
MKRITDYILKNEWAAIAALTGLAAIIRIIPVLQADFPLNEGGMFYVMAKNLSENHYRLPAYTSYNFSNIPFGYSPLAFYLMAGLHDMFQLSYIDILRFVPAALDDVLKYYVDANHYDGVMTLAIRDYPQEKRTAAAKIYLDAAYKDAPNHFL